MGSKVAKVAEDFGIRVLLNDLPREEKEGKESFTSLNKIAEECDIITFHVPLYKEGKYKTFHLADEDFFNSLKRKPVIINTSRGEVIDTGTLLKALNNGSISDAIIDVWEHEPEINRELLEKVIIGTPHIAGYSADGKANATRMSLDAICKFFHIEGKYEINAPAPTSPIIHAQSQEEADVYKRQTLSRLIRFRILRPSYTTFPSSAKNLGISSICFCKCVYLGLTITLITLFYKSYLQRLCKDKEIRAYSDYIFFFYRKTKIKGDNLAIYLASQVCKGLLYCLKAIISMRKFIGYLQYIFHHFNVLSCNYFR